MSRERTPFGQRMLDAREKAGLTQMDVRKALGLSQGTLSGLEHTANGSSHVVRFAELYKCDANWLSTGVASTQSSALNPTNAEVHSRVAEPELGLHYNNLTSRERDLILAFRGLPLPLQDARYHQMMSDHEEINRYSTQIVAREGVSGRVSDARAAEKLPPPPSGGAPETAPGALTNLGHPQRK
jgi:transcriptional regulator with XRE-family HTH domain